MSSKADRAETRVINQTENKISDTTGKFTVAVKNGTQVDQVSWLEGRIILSDQRLILLGDSGQLAIDFSDITGLSGQKQPDRSLAALSDYMRVELGSDVVIIVPEKYESFRERFFTTTLEGETVRCKHPAVSGGVVQTANWETARLGIDANHVVVTLNDGTQATLEFEELSDTAVTKQTINGAERTVIHVSHLSDKTMVETHIAVPQRARVFAQSLFKQAERRSQTDIELTRTEQEVLLALHTGVRPFDIPSFVGSDVTTIEETFDQLIEYGIIDRVRMRQEVELNASGRNIAANALDG